MSFGRFELENGQYIDDVVLGYTTYGELNAVRPSLSVLARSDRARRAFSVFPPRRDPRRATHRSSRPTISRVSQAGDNAVNKIQPDVQQ